MAGSVFVAEWGDLAPATNPLLTAPTDYREVRINPNTKLAEPFASNPQMMAASSQGAKGMGFERPFDVEFGADGAMYISDYGEAKVNVEKLKADMPRTGEPSDQLYLLLLLGVAGAGLLGTGRLMARRTMR